MTYLSDVGFRDGSGRDRLQTTRLARENGEAIKAGGATYFRWAVDERLELWARSVEGETIPDIYSYFVGDSRFPVAIIKKVPRSCTLFSDGAFLCRSKPCAGDGWVSGQLPFVVDTPSYHLYDSLAPPRVAVMQVTGSAKLVIGYESEEEYEEANPPDDEGYGWQAQHFVPLYMVNPVGEDGEIQRPMVEVSGFVLDTDIITNPLTGVDFCWARIETICGEVDVVCSPEGLQGYLHKGGVAVGYCYLNGRILSDDSN